MQIKHLNDFKPVLDKLCSTRFKDKNKSLSLMRFRNALKTHYDFYDSEKLKMFKEWGETNCDGMRIKEPYVKEFLQSIDELANIEVSELPQLEVNIDDIINQTFQGDDDDTWLSANDMQNFIDFAEHFNLPPLKLKD